MQPGQYQELRALFVAAVATTADARARFLAEVARTRPELHAELQSLLAEHERSGAFLTAPAAWPPAPLPVPARIGTYRILRVLGEGGMGIVYLAEQEQPRRQVALKVVRPGLATPRALRRFEVELQALARLRHPGIAQIHDAGHADSGLGPQPYFAMELVDGVTLLQAAAERRMDQRTRLLLLAQVCDAVHHAHQKGVIHCDLKPGNILVDERGQARVLDFGVARVTDRESAHTGLHSQQLLVGTLAYMSPEQTLGDPEQIDIRSDVYALGVVGYELLTGALPYDLTGIPLPEAVHRIREQEPAPPAQRSRALRGDLDTVLRKALHKDRAQRYQAASELAADLGRFLRHEPIAARPPGLGYSLRKFAARHRALVAGGAVALAALVVGSVGLTLGLLRARAAEARAVRAADFLERRIAGTDPWLTGAEVRLPELLERAATEVADTFADDPETRARMHAALGRSLAGIDRLAPAEAALRAAHAWRSERLGPRHPDTLDSTLDLAQLLHKRGATVEAAALYTDVAAAGTEVLGPRHLIPLSARYGLARLQSERGDPTGAEASLQGLLPDLALGLGPDHGFVAVCRDALAQVQFEQGHLIEAEASMRALVAYADRNWPGEHPRRLHTLAGHATCLNRLGRQAEAEAILRDILPVCRRVLGVDHLTTATVLDDLGEALLGRGVFPQAETMLRKALEVRRGKLGDDHRETIHSANNVAMLLYAMHRCAEAEPACRAVLATAERVLGADHHETLLIRSNLAAIVLERADFRAAETMLRDGLARLRKVVGEDHPLTLATLAHLATLYQRQDRLAEAEPVFRTIAERTLDRFGKSHDHTMKAWNNLAMTLLSLGRAEAALPILRDLLDQAQRERGDDDPITVTQRSNLGSTLMDLGRWPEAEPLLAQAVADRQRLLGAQDPAILWPLHNLCRALVQQDKRPQADARIQELLALWQATRTGPLPPNAQGAMVDFGRLLLETDRLAQASALFRDLADTVLALPASAWTRDSITAVLGHCACLVRGGQDDAAEALLLRAWSSLEPDSRAGDRRRRDLLRGLIAHYERRQVPAAAARYRALLGESASQPASQPATQPADR